MTILNPFFGKYGGQYPAAGHDDRPHPGCDQRHGGDFGVTFHNREKIR